MKKIIFLVCFMFYMVYPFNPIIVESNSILGIATYINGFPVRGFEGLYPFVIVNDKNDKELINHELIHFVQVSEVLPIVYHLQYLRYYLTGRFQGLDSSQAYFNVCFEKEAYKNERNLEYLLTRMPFAYMLCADK